MRMFVAITLGVSTYIGCALSGWFNGPFAVLLACVVFVFVSAFRAFRKKPSVGGFENTDVTD